MSRFGLMSILKQSKRFLTQQHLFDYKKIYKEHYYVNYHEPKRMARAYYLFPNFDSVFQPNVTPYEGTVEFNTQYHGPIDIIDRGFCTHRLLAHIAYYEGRIILNGKICQDYRTIMTKDDSLELLHYNLHKDILSKYLIKVIGFELLADGTKRKYLIQRNGSINVPLDHVCQQYPVLWKNIEANKDRFLGNNNVCTKI